MTPKRHFEINWPLTNLKIAHWKTENWWRLKARKTAGWFVDWLWVAKDLLGLIPMHFLKMFETHAGSRNRWMEKFFKKQCLMIFIPFQDWETGFNLLLLNTFVAEAIADEKYDFWINILLLYRDHPYIRSAYGLGRWVGSENSHFCRLSVL